MREEKYYLYNIYYDRVLGQKTDGTPGLSKLNTNTIADSYVFVAEASGTEGYYLLRQKSSNKYLTASTSNTYSLVFLTSAGTGNNYLWSINDGLDGYISSKRSPTKYLGCDTGKESDTYVGVYYDKELNDLARWQIVSAQNGFDAGRKQLYLDVLQRAIERGLKVSVQLNYPANLRQKVATATTAAQDVYNNAAQKTLTEIITATSNLQSVLMECLASDMTTLLSTTNFDVNDAFTLALNQLKFNSDGEFSMLVRNAKGNGAIIEISPSRVSVDYQSIAENLPAVDVANYQFAFTGTSVMIYRNGTLLGTGSSFAVPAYTSIGTAAEWSLLGVGVLDSYIPEVISASKLVEQGTSVTDKYGNNVRYAVFMKKQNLTLSEPVDFHIMNENDALTNSTINLTNDKAWLILDNALPSDVLTKYISSISVNGVKATNNYNVRVGVYLNGTVIMPYKTDIKPFTGYSSENYSGVSTDLKLGQNELAKTSNSFRSFILKRGYMATVASGSNGSGYSRVYVADHQDIMVQLLPQALDKRITSVHIKKWNYVSKKGWCSTTGSSAIATECKKMRATWFYTWSADRSSTSDSEFIPIKQHLYWPSNSQIDGQTNSTHVLSFNEPEHAEQHTSDKCSCGGTISTWTACTKTPDLQTSGMRIGSPAPTDPNWLTEYITYCNNMAYRCDFVAVHCYWGTNEAPNAASWYSQLKSIYDKTKRPIWITEWNNGASWTTETWPSGYGDRLEKNRQAIKEILNVMDTCRFIERYSIYNWDTYYRAMINYNDGWVTPAGEVYRDNKSTFAYNADVQFTPVWWAPATKAIKLRAKVNSLTGRLVFTATNENGDMTDMMIIQRKKADGTYENYYTEADRSLFDVNENTYSFNLNDFDIDSDEFRLYVKTTTGAEIYSGVIGLGYLVNPNIVTTATTQVDGWTCSKSAANGYSKSTGDSFLEVWDSSPLGMHFNYYQDITELAEGVYELSAACFNSTNGLVGSTVNGHVGLYAQADGVEYFAPVTEDGELNLQKRQIIPYVVVKNGVLRIGIKKYWRYDSSLGRCR
ncbi:MAG: glycosyl hydrolase [Paludibacteraceae bacterium]